MDMIVTLPGNMKVDVEYKGFTIHTDQPAHAGGDGSAPTPFDTFLASIGACAGIFIVFFCQKRDIPFDNIRVVQRMERNAETRMITNVALDIELPPDFPEKYKPALIKTVDLCTVKRHLVDPPEFEIKTVTVD